MSEETETGRAEARGDRNPRRQERLEKVIEKRQTWFTEGKQSLDTDKAQRESL